MKRLIILIAWLAALWAQSVYAQQWQPTTWPPPAPPVCQHPLSADQFAVHPFGCDGIVQMNEGLWAAGYQLANQRAVGYGTDVPMDIQGAGYYGQRQMERWDVHTGRYSNEAWMWQPSPAAQQQWQQQRGRWQR